MTAQHRVCRWLVCIVATVATMAHEVQYVHGSLASYVFVTTNGNQTLLVKYDGTTMIDDTTTYSGGPLVVSEISSGGGLSLLSTASFAAVVNPGLYGNGLSDVVTTGLAGPWMSPIGRHGQLASGPNPLGIYRATATAGVPGYTLLDGTQSIGLGIQMGDFAHDLFSGGADGHTHIGAQSSNSYLDLGAFTITERVQASSGAIAQESTGGIYYIQPNGTQTLIPGVTSMDNSIGGKVGSQYAMFNADGRTWLYDSVNNLAASQSSSNITAFVRVGSQALVQFNSGAYTLDASANYTSFAGGPNRVTSGVSFGDYAMYILDGATRRILDNGNNTYTDANWSGATYNLALATGGYIGVINDVPVPEPSSVVLIISGVAVCMFRKRNRSRN